MIHNKHIFHIFILAAILAIGCGQLAKKEESKKIDTAIKTNQLIVPGKRIGDINLNDNADSLIKKLGKPDFSDGAMGSSLAMWYSGHDSSGTSTSVFAQRNMGGADESINHIKEIRVTSPAYKTDSNIGVGSELKGIQKAYTVKMRPVPGAKANNKISFYNDYKGGIGFEVDEAAKCTAVLVYAKGDTSVTMINMRVGK